MGDSILMKILALLAEKVVVIEVMLIILNMAMIYFGFEFSFLSTCLMFLTPVAVIAFILYIILSILNTKIFQTALGVVLGGIILYYLYKYILR